MHFESSELLARVGGGDSVLGWMVIEFGKFYILYIISHSGSTATTNWELERVEPAAKREFLKYI